MTVLAWVLAVAIVLNVALFVGLLSSSRRVRGGPMDLTAAAARGELNLDWSWPQYAPTYAPTIGPLDPYENGDDLSAPTTWAA